MFYLTHSAHIIHFVVIQSLGYVKLFATPWTTTHLSSLSSTISWSLLKVISIESVMLSNHRILHCPLLLLPSLFPSIRVFFSELVLHVRWLKDWNFSFSISHSNEYSGFLSCGIFQTRMLEWIAISSRGIFPTQRLNLYTLCFLHCRQILHLLSHQGSPYNTLGSELITLHKLNH